jgi:hypothetical protein
LQSLEDLLDRFRREPAESANQPLAVDSAKLIQSNEARSALKPARHTPRICLPARRHGRHNYGAQVLIEFVR